MKKLVLAFLIVAPCVSAQQSRLGTYNATVDITGSDNQSGRQRDITITVSRGASRLFDVVKPIPYDVAPPAIGLFESGSLMLVHAFSGRVEFYRPDGILIQTVMPVENLAPDHERVMSFAVHDTNAVLLVSDPGRQQITYVSVTQTGEITGRTDLPGQFANAVVVSNGGTANAAGTTEWEETSLRQRTFLLDQSGSVYSSFNVGCEGGVFSPDDSLLLVTTKNQAVIIDHSTLQTSAVVTMPDHLMIHGGAWSGGSFYLLSSEKPALINGRWMYTGPVVQRMDAGRDPETIRSYPALTFTVARLKNFGDDVLLELDGMNQNIRE